MEELDFQKAGGIIPAVAQDYLSGEVLMLAYINPEAWQETLRTGRAVYFSRSRNRLWRKGEESGNVQIIKEILVDCDGDAVIYRVEQKGGAACHTGTGAVSTANWKTDPSSSRASRSSTPNKYTRSNHETGLF